jgi:hypothetical protein
MFRFLPYVLRSILRNRGRAALTVAVVAIGTAIIFSFFSLEQSLYNTIEKSGSDVNLIVQQANQW